MSADRTLSLSLRVTSHDGRPDLDILLDGRPAFSDVAPGWKGFDPDHMLGVGSPLLPVPGGRWVALNRCTCGEPGCGTVAAWVEPSADGARVAWSDFRDFVGVFHRPVVDEITDVEVAHSKPWDLPSLHFDRAQYVAEVERASADRSWETPGRTTARLLHERLALTQPVLPGGSRWCGSRRCGRAATASPWASKEPGRPTVGHRAAVPPPDQHLGRPDSCGRGAGRASGVRAGGAVDGRVRVHALTPERGQSVTCTMPWAPRSASTMMWLTTG